MTYSSLPRSRSDTVCLALGLLFLKSRMRTLVEDWKPMYLKNKLMLWGVSFIFVGFNAAILILTALPIDKGEIPRFYWPVTIAAIIAAAVLHWLVIRALRMKWRGSQTTLGQRVGFEVKVYSQDDEEDIPDSLNHLMQQAIADGSRRRIEYKVRSDFPISLFLWLTVHRRQGPQPSECTKFGLSLKVF